MSSNYKSMRKIEPLGNFSYLVTMASDDGEIIETVCHVRSSEATSHSSRNFVTFDSQDFQKEIALGHIMAREVASAVLNLHNTRKKS